jgi:AraC-like DNA-binding protein
MLGHMETRADLIQRVRRERQLITRLQRATTQRAETERERIWAMVAAHEAGLSIRKIAAATGLSASRVHQLLQADEAREIPAWLSQLRDRAVSSDDEAAAPQSSCPRPRQRRLADEAEVVALVH